MAGWSAKRIMSNEWVMLVMNDGLVSVSGGGRGARPQVSLPGEGGRVARYEGWMMWEGDWSWTWDVVDGGWVMEVTAQKFGCVLFSSKICRRTIEAPLKLFSNTPNRSSAHV